MARYLALFENHLGAITMMTDEQAGQLIKALTAVFMGEQPTITDPAVLAYISSSNIMQTVKKGIRLNDLRKERKERSKENKENNINNNNNINNKKEIKEIYKEKKKKENGTDEPDNRPLRDGDNPLARVRVLC
jgi:histone acetyltransferase (RNA polymerase elongator complex component)